MARKTNTISGWTRRPPISWPLTPLSFLARTAAIYPNHVSTVYEGRVFTWSQTYARCRRFASYLAGRNIGHGDTVAAMLPNIPAMNEAAFCGADGGRGAQRAQHPARCRLDRFPARSWRRQDHPGRSGICRRDRRRRSTLMTGPKASGHRRRRQGFYRRKTDRRDRI